MAVGLSIRFADGTAEQYDAINAEMGVESDPPEGLIFHAAGPIKDGWGILDFWESRAQFDRFHGEPDRPCDRRARRCRRRRTRPRSRSSPSTT